MIKMADPQFTEADRLRIHRELDAILSGALSMGPNVQAFETEFAGMVGVRHAVAMNSCTSALEIALGSRPIAGAEVVVPAETFVATGMAVHLVGATPVFADISPDTLCLDIEDVIRRVTKKTRAIILVHMAGFVTPDILEFRNYCDEMNLLLIEDAAHAPGARRCGRLAGAFGHVGCFSFYPTKVLTAGEGGMLTTDDDQIAAYARSQQHRGRDMHADGEHYRLPGRNVRMTEIAALLGRIQLSHLDEFLARRRSIAEVYRRELKSEARATLVAPVDMTASSCWKMPVLLDRGIERRTVTQWMKASGVSVDWAYTPAMHLQPVFRQLYGFAEGHLPRTEDLLSRHICLPCHPGMSLDDAAYVARTLIDALDDARML